MNKQDDIYEALMNWTSEVSESVLLLKTAFRFTEDDDTFKKADREQLDNLITVAHDKMSTLIKAMIAKGNDIA